VACIVVNDGSNQQCTRVLEKLSQSFDIHLLTHKENQGKGAAIITALQFANQQNYTHALQIDADGQHDLNDINRFLAVAEQQPDALINGVPEYDHSVPKSRLYGRKISTFWVRINTLSSDIIDVLCGFRVYPVSRTVDLIQQRSIGLRMEFDLEIMSISIVIMLRS
jgi:glycosyltransferase involved in cell wall biosynthesis